MDKEKYLLKRIIYKLDSLMNSVTLLMSLSFLIFGIVISPYVETSIIAIFFIAALFFAVLGAYGIIRIGVEK